MQLLKQREDLRAEMQPRRTARQQVNINANRDAASIYVTCGHDDGRQQVFYGRYVGEKRLKNGGRADITDTGSA